MGYIKCTARNEGNKCGKNRRIIVSVVNDVNLLLKLRENEKSRPKAWNHQLQHLSLSCPSEGRFDLSVLEFVCRGRHGSVARQAEGLERRGKAKRGGGMRRRERS